MWHLAIIIFFTLTPNIGTIPTWTHSEILDNLGDVILRWYLLQEKIIFRIEAKTKGYVVLKFSSDGTRENSDIIVGWVDNRDMKASLLDCHGDTGPVPVVDKTNNYILLKGNQNQTHTILEFERAFNTCDPEDYQIMDDIVTLVWAFHNQDPLGSLGIHYNEDQKGVQDLAFFAPPLIPKPTNQDILTWNLIINQASNPQKSAYWSKIFKPPFLSKKKHQIIGYKPLIAPNHSIQIRRMFLYKCKTNRRKDCSSKIIIWTIGSTGEFFHEDFGITLSPKKYYLLEIYFNNPIRRVEGTGLRLYYSTIIRKFEGGVFEVGITRSPLHFIPPYQEEYKTAGYCSTNCTKATVPKSGTKIASVIFHAGSIAEKMKLRHIRAGKELAPLASNNRYNPSYDRFKILGRNSTILPGDGLILECSYSTVSRNQPIFGGSGLGNEMCLAYVYHYPKLKLSKCHSLVPLGYFFETLGVEKFYQLEMKELDGIFLSDEFEIRKMFDELVIKKPKKFENTTFTEHLLRFHYNDSSNLEEQFYFGKHLTFCKDQDDSFIDKKVIQHLPDFVVYKNNNNRNWCKSGSSVSKASSPSTSSFISILFVALQLSKYM